jgi:hydroxymethylbilane synthase
VPIAALARVDGRRLTLRGLVAGVQGERIVRGAARGDADDPEAVGAQVAEELLAGGAAEILRAISGATR